MTPRMRLVTEAFLEIKAADPDTALTLCGLRRLINSGDVPIVQFGRKRLVNLDLLLDYLNSQNTLEPFSCNSDKIRPISI